MWLNKNNKILFSFFLSPSITDLDFCSADQWTASIQEGHWTMVS